MQQRLDMSLFIVCYAYVGIFYAYLCVFDGAPPRASLRRPPPGPSAAAPHGHGKHGKIYKNKIPYMVFEAIWYEAYITPSAKVG